MKKLFLLILIEALLTFHLKAQPEIIWQKCFGGTHGDAFIDAKRTSDGGYICLGNSDSEDFDLEGVCCNKGGFDYWIVKFDSNFNILWQKQFGTEIGTEVPNSIFINFDGTFSIFGVVEGNSGDCTCNHSSSQDIWMVTLSSTGNIINQKCFGGSSYDILYNVSKCEDGGYLIGAYSGSGDGDVGIHYGSDFSTDAFIVKTNELGEIQWTKTIGGTGYDGAVVTGLSGNRCLINIVTSSKDHDLAGLVPDGETYGRLMIITDGAGNIIKEQYDRSYGHLFELLKPYEISPNNYLLLGYNQIDTGIFSGNKGGIDAIIAIYDSNLILSNVFQFGGSEIDVFENMHILNDSTFYFTGYSYSSDFDTQGDHGEEEDAFIVKTDMQFNKIWSKTLGASGGDRCSIISSLDTNILLIGGSSVYGENDGDIIGAHYDASIGANGDGWLIIMEDRISMDSSDSLNPNINIYPNPAQDLITIEITDNVISDYYLEVISLTGQIVIKTDISDNAISEVDVYNLPAGIYIFKISNNTSPTYTKKIIIQ